MDYYSGAPEPNDYNINNGFEDNNGFNFGNFFRKNSVLILVCLAALIFILILIFVFLGKDSKTEYNKKDDDSYLSELSVDGGVLEPTFTKDVVKYNVVAYSDSISFTCKASSKKAKVEGCDEIIEIDDDKVSYNIKVIAEDKNVTRYYFTITKSSDIQNGDNDIDF